MSTPPLPPAPPPKPISLAVLATIFAVTFGLAFGLCTVSAFRAGGNVNQYVIGTALVVEAICLVGLVVVGILAIVRSARKQE
jgi:hypothetical protein